MEENQSAGIVSRHKDYESLITDFSDLALSEHVDELKNVLEGAINGVLHVNEIIHRGKADELDILQCFNPMTGLFFAWEYYRMAVDELNKRFEDAVIRDEGVTLP